jgi:transcriptional regulator
MYLPPLFREKDPARLHDLIDAHPFGTLIVPGEDGGLEIAHVPFVLDRDPAPLGQLRVHVAAVNPMWRLAASRPVVALFQGPDAYVSASWYEKPREQVPTWNYAVVQAHGRVAEVMTAAETRRLLGDLTAIHEKSEEDRWRPENLEKELMDKLLQQIVGLTIPIARMEGKFKLSQNRSETDRTRVRTALAGRGERDMVRLMEENELRRAR